MSAPAVSTRAISNPRKTTSSKPARSSGFFEGRLGLTASIFRINKNNAKADDGLGNIISTGDAQRVQGIELGVVGTVTENWSITANYAFLDSETTESADRGMLSAIASPNVPEHSAALWTTYVPIAGLTLGIGATYAGKVYLNNTNLAFVPEAFSIDALIAYQLGQWRLPAQRDEPVRRLNYAGSQNGRAVPSPGRTFIFSVGTVF